VLALLASLLLHLALLLVLQRRPVSEAHRQRPLQFTVLQRPPPPASAPAPPPHAAALPGRPGREPAGHPGPPSASSAPTLGTRPLDSPFALPALPGPPSLREMSERAAEAVTELRGPTRAPPESVGTRLAAELRRGLGEVVVARRGYWDAYFTLLRKALLAAWPADGSRALSSRKRSVRIRLVLDAEGELRDFELLFTSGDKLLDLEVERALHTAAPLPAPPAHVLQGKTVLVSEWELTVHPGLAHKVGLPMVGPLGPGIAFDMVQLFDSRIDLTPLERNVTLSSYWTQ
jgi:periplasmic protein TonB